MKNLPVVMTAIFLVVSSPILANGLNAQDLLKEIDKSGGNAVVHQLIAHPSHGDWDFVLSRIATGDAEWLKVAARFGDTIDTESDNELPLLGVDDALIRAIPHSPDGVLALLGKSYKAVSVCGSGPHNAPKSESLEIVNAAIAALKVSDKGNTNADTKGKCLNYLQELQTSLNKWSNDPPEELMPSIRELAALVGDGYTETGWNGLEYLKYSGRGPSANGDEVNAGYLVLFSTEGEGGGNNSTQYLAYFSDATSGGYWTVKRFVLNSFLAIGGRGWRSLHLKAIDKDFVMLDGKAQTSNDAMCCPSKPVAFKVKILASGLAYASPSGGD